jgi:ABC-2 type transport system permease protein
VSVYSYADRRRAPLRGRVAHYARVLRVLAGKEFKLKYADSSLGYIWSILKPLSYFAVLWVVFGRFFKLGGVREYPLYLLVGIVLFTFFVDAISVALPSIVVRGEVLRRIAFPRMIIPIAGTLTAAMTFAVNSCAVAVFAVIVQLQPRVGWLLIPLLLLELYIFILGLALALAALFVRFRDVIQVWELVTQLLLFASAVMFPVAYLPPWFQPVDFANPFFQVMQDIRVLLIGVNQPHETITAVYGTPFARLLPIGIAFGTFALGVWYFRREAPTLAEHV